MKGYYRNGDLPTLWSFAHHTRENLALGSWDEDFQEYLHDLPHSEIVSIWMQFHVHELSIFNDIHVLKTMTAFSIQKCPPTRNRGSEGPTTSGVNILKCFGVSNIDILEV